MLMMFKELESHDEDSGVSYVPFVDEEWGTAGVQITRPSGVVDYLYFNPSGGSDDGVPTVFVYRGESTNPGEAGSLCHFDVT